MGSLGEQDPQIKAVLDALQADPDEALRKAEDLLRLARGQGDKALEARAKRALSSVHLQQGSVGAAVAAAEESLAAFGELGDGAGQAAALRALAEARLAEGRAEEALQSLAGPLARFRSAGDRKGEASVLLLQAEVKSAQEQYDEAVAAAGEAAEIYTKLDAKDKDQAVGYSLVKLSEFYASAWKPTEALLAAEAALGTFRGIGGREGRLGEGASLHAMALANSAAERQEVALANVKDAVAIFSSLDDKAAQSAAMRTEITIYLADKRKAEARTVAKEAVAIVRASKDLKGEAAAQLLLAEVCLQTMDNGEAVAAAMEAFRLYKVAGSKAGQAAALTTVTAADFENESGQAVWAAGERADLFKGTSDHYQEADALLSLANLHAARVGRKLAKCSIAAADDSIAALKAAKDAHGLFAFAANMEGMEQAMRTIARVLMYNGVAPEVIEATRDPEEIFQDVMSGKYSDPYNALPQKFVPITAKLEEIVPSSKQLERGKFAWSNPMAGYSYTMIWQPAKDREVRRQRPRGAYDIMALNPGAKTTSASTLIQARSSDAGAGQDSLVVFMLSTDCKTAYASTMMAALQTIGAMITARLSRLTFVQFDEAHFDWTDTKARQCSMYPVILGLLRSARLEAPNVTIGFVGGDAASWIADPAPMIESIFDTVETDESEVFYKRGDAFAPLLIHRPLEEAVNFVKPKKKSGWGAHK